MSRKTKFLGLAVLSMTLASGPVISAYAAGSDNPSPPASDSGSSKGKKAKKDKSSAIDDQKFLAGYRAAYTTIYDKHDYTAAIGQLKALGQDDRADVANLIGYSYRKLGDYKVSQIWYERALKADPAHDGSVADDVRHQARGRRLVGHLIAVAFKVVVGEAFDPAMAEPAIGREMRLPPRIIHWENCAVPGLVLRPRMRLARQMLVH